MLVNHQAKPQGLQQVSFTNNNRRSYVGGPYFGGNTDNTDKVELSQSKPARKTTRNSVLQGMLLGAAALVGGSFFFPKAKG